MPASRDQESSNLAGQETSREPDLDHGGTNAESQEQDIGPDLSGDGLIQVAIVLPSNADKLSLTVSPHEQVHELRQSIQELPAAFQHSCFHLEHAGERINDYIQISEIPGISQGSEIKVVLDPYTEKEARLHLIRIRELIGAAGDRTDTVHGILAGTSIFDGVIAPQELADGETRNEQSPKSRLYDFTAPPNIASLLPKSPEPSPKTVKTISLSPWNPPPPHLRQRGHLLYLVITTNEGEQHQITSHVGGFYVNRSSNSKFDPSPRPSPKSAFAHSLLNLIEEISPSFSASFGRLQEITNRRDPLATFQITNAIPAPPWLVPSTTSPLCAHQSDMTRSQESYLISGIDSTDTLRDWNEEFQSARELPRDAIQDRVFRERLISKLFADYTDAAAKGAVLVARGEVAPLNPTEAQEAQIFVYNNIFFSFGADGVGTFTSEGGDEAARVATGKDVMGVRLVNQLDVDGIFTPATVVVDYLGRRIVGQSIVPGIFKQREPGENQIDYGAVDGRDIVAADEKFAPGFAKLSAAFKVKKHPVWDKHGKRFDLEGSVETKGLFGTDGRKYVLDLYRITPLDIAWVEGGGAGEGHPRQDNLAEKDFYPHRMTVLRPELVEAYSRYKMREYLTSEHRRLEEMHLGEEQSKGEKGDEASSSIPRVDLSGFKFGLNPDVFSGQSPQTEAEKAEMLADEQEVRQACTYLLDTVIPALLDELKESELSFPMDGRSLSKMLHKRGINIRYLGTIASQCHGPRLRAMADVCVQDMIARSFKHIASSYLKYLPLPMSSECISHLLNCLLGDEFNPQPLAVADESMRLLYPAVQTTFTEVTPESLRKEIELETAKRFRYNLPPQWNDSTRRLQLLREVSLKLGLQLQVKDFQFQKQDASATPTSTELVNSVSTVAGALPVESRSRGEPKKKRKKGREGSPTSSASSAATPTTFSPDDILNVVPVVKDSAPRSTLAEEAFEAGRISLVQQQKKLGQDLLLESLSLHEQIYGILHPQVARIYHQLSLLYFQLDEKEAAIELARKAIIVSERTIGVDSEETLLNYLNLSLFLHQTGDSTGALAYAKHALDLWKVIFGYGHPDSVTTLNNAAVMLQNLKAYHESRRWFEESLRICETIFGSKSVNSATLLFQLAQALALDGDANGSVAKMRDSYTIFKDELGPDDKNTKEAESWLDQLTQSAVAIKKNAKELEARRLRAGIRFPTRTMVGTSSVAIGSTSVISAQEKPPAVDQRNIDDLLRFIEGTDQIPISKKKPSRGNPKRRGKA